VASDFKGKNLRHGGSVERLKRQMNSIQRHVNLGHMSIVDAQRYMSDYRRRLRDEGDEDKRRRADLNKRKRNK